MSKSALSAPWSQSDSPDSISVRRPVHLRYLSVEKRPPSGIHHRIPVAITLHPSPPSGWVRDLPIIARVAMIDSPLRTCAVPGTQQLQQLD